MSFNVKSSTEEFIGISDDFPKLPSGTVHIWHVYFDEIPGLLEQCKRVLSEVELGVIPYFKFDQAKESYIVSQGTLRMLLSKYQLTLIPSNMR